MKKLLAYFDLNKRRPSARITVDRLRAEDMIGLHVQDIGVRENKVLQKSDEPVSDEELEKILKEFVRDKYFSKDHFTLWDQALMYIGIFLGVLLSSAVAQFKSGKHISFQFSLATIVISAVVALIIVPQAFEKLKMQPSAPFIVRFGFFVQNGVFWRVIFEAVGKAISA